MLGLVYVRYNKCGRSHNNTQVDESAMKLVYYNFILMLLKEGGSLLSLRDNGLTDVDTES